MRKRLLNPRLAKIHRNYTVEEVANLYGIHKNTVSAWIKDGLETINDKRPVLILGQDLAAFIKDRRKKNKQPCRPEEFYCLRCRTPKIPAGEMADYNPVTDKFGNLVAICPDCDTIMNKRVSMAKIELVCRKIDISFPEALRHIVDRIKPTVNSDLR